MLREKKELVFTVGEKLADVGLLISAMCTLDLDRNGKSPQIEKITVIDHQPTQDTVDQSVRCLYVEVEVANVYSVIELLSHLKAITFNQALTDAGRPSRT